MNRLISIRQWENYELFEYKPTLFHPFYNDMEPLTIQRRVRFLIEFFRGYKCYYLSADRIIVAYSVVSPGGGRYSFASNEDIVVGPYFVAPEYRGNHYSELLVREILNLDSLKYNAAYDWVRKNNIASMKTSNRIGFTIVGTASLQGPFRRIVMSQGDNGSINILKYSK